MFTVNLPRFKLQNRFLLEKLTDFKKKSPQSDHRFKSYAIFSFWLVFVFGREYCIKARILGKMTHKWD